MQHTLAIDGYCYRLRPVTLDDAGFIIETRTENAERSKYINPISKDISSQVSWLENYFKTPDDYYFVIENISSGDREGLISLYNITDNKGESGRWIIKQDSLAAVESFYLLYRIAFEILYLDEVFCNVVADNKSVISFHKAVKQKLKGIKHNFYSINNYEYDAIEFYIDKKYFFETIQPRMEHITKSIWKKKINYY